MTHDPLCPVGVKPWEDTYCCQTCNPGETPSWELACRCDEYAKVRADERIKAAVRVNSLPSGANLSVAAAVAAGDVDAGAGW